MAQTELSKQLRGPLNDRLASTLRLCRRIKPHNRELRRQPVALDIGRADFVRIGGRKPPRTAHLYAVLSCLLHRNVGEVANHVGQDVAPGVADLVQHLLGNHRSVHQATGACGLGTDKAAIGGTLHDRVADVGPIRHAGPVGVQPARGLATAFNDVTCEAACREQVKFVRAPAKLVHQHAQRHRRVHTTPGDDNLRPGVKRGADRQCAQVGIGRENFFG